jgi:hypothetical protein
MGRPEVDRWCAAAQEVYDRQAARVDAVEGTDEYQAARRNDIRRLTDAILASPRRYYGSSTDSILAIGFDRADAADKAWSYIDESGCTHHDLRQLLGPAEAELYLTARAMRDAAERLTDEEAIIIAADPRTYEERRETVRLLHEAIVKGSASAMARRRSSGGKAVA